MTIIVINVLLCGCGTSGAKPAPDRAGLSILVRAEPKAGWRGDDRTSYDLAAVGTGRTYETLNYAALDEIVVWIDIPDPADAIEPKRLSIDVGRAGGALVACGERDQWSITNSAREAIEIYARTESGGVIDLGTIAPAGQVEHPPRESGFFEIACDARTDVLARIYVAPVATGANNRVQVVRSGSRVNLSDLPPGEARIGCWHPRLPGSEAHVRLVSGTTLRKTLSVGVDQLPRVP